MNNIKFLTSISIGILAYVLISIFAGTDGIWAYNQLNLQKNILSTNVDRITKINDTLILDQIALENDVGIITSKARELGFIYEGEKLIKINGISNNEKSFYDTGAAIVLEDISCVSEQSCKLIGFICFILSLLIMNLVEYKMKGSVRAVTMTASVFVDIK